MLKFKSKVKINQEFYQGQQGILIGHRVLPDKKIIYSVRFQVGHQDFIIVEATEDNVEECKI